MNICSVYARQDGTIAHVADSTFPITPDPDTTRVIQFSIDAYPVEYQHISDNSKTAFWDGANLQIDSVVYLNAAWVAARQTEITQADVKAIARTLMLSDAKNYLSAQLQSASPNVQTIFTTVKNYVDGNATLTQMLTNQIALFNTAYGVTVNPAGVTAADRTRYLICCQLVLATIA
jgi:hypothetical protein